MENFKNQIALVTGAGSGIGKAIALALAEEGAIVCLLERRLKALEAIRSDARETIRNRLIPYQVDLTQDAELSSLAVRLRSDFQHVHILVHSAGVFRRGSVADSPATDFDLQYRTNVLVPYALTQALLPILEPQRAQVVFVNSTAGLTAAANLSQYSATKHALKAIADSLRQEVNRDGIRVLSLYLGRTATPMQACIHTMENKEYLPGNLMQPEDVAAVLTNALSLARTAEVTEIRMRPLKSPTP